MESKEEPGVPAWIGLRAAKRKLETEALRRQMEAAGFEILWGVDGEGLASWEAWVPVMVPRLGDGAMLGRVHHKRPGYVELLGKAGRRLWVLAEEVTEESRVRAELAYAPQRARDLTISGRPALEREEAETWLCDLISLHAELLEAKRKQIPGQDSGRLRTLSDAWQAAREKAVRQLVLLGLGEPWKEAP